VWWAATRTASAPDGASRCRAPCPHSRSVRTTAQPRRPGKSGPPLRSRRSGGHHQAQAVEPAERGHIGRGESASGSSVEHVEVFRSGRVRTPIIGRSRPSHADPQPDDAHTLDCEAPLNVDARQEHEPWSLISLFMPFPMIETEH
jgi:hypothetical protein